MNSIDELTELTEETFVSVEPGIVTDYYDKKPIYVTFFDNLQDYIKINRFSLYILVSLVPYLVYLPISYFFNINSGAFSEYWLKLNFSGWALGSFLFMNYIYKKATSVYTHLSYLANTAYNRHLLFLSYDRLFHSPLQNIVCIFIGLLTSATGTYLGMLLPDIPNIYIIINSFFVGYILGFGVWFSIGLGLLIRDVSNMKNVKLNYINPSYSIGIFEIPRLASIWSLCFFGESIIVYIGLLLPQWSKSGFNTGAIQVFWLTVFLFISVYNYIYPIVSISNLANESKTRFKKIVSDRLYEKLSIVEGNMENLSDITNDIKQIDSLFEKLSLSKSYLFDWSVVIRFFATAIPTLFIIVFEHYDTIKRLFNIIKGNF
jgi:hypothetical protein